MEGASVVKPFSELTGREKLVELARWACVPPAAVLGVLVPHFLAGFVMRPPVAQPPGTPTPDPDLGRLLARVLFVFVGATFVLAGAGAAPRRRLATAVVLAILWALYCLTIHVLVRLYHGGVPHYMSFAASSAPAVCAAACVFFVERWSAERGRSE
jgi:hypothetical protein